MAGRAADPITEPGPIRWVRRDSTGHFDIYSMSNRGFCDLRGNRGTRVRTECVRARQIPAVPADPASGALRPSAQIRRPWPA